MAAKCVDDDKGDNTSTKLLQMSGCPKGQRVIPECEVFFENDTDTLETRYKKCTKHPGHINFISVDKFTVKHLPRELRTTKMIEDIFRRCVLTLRVKAKYTSLDRPDTFADSDAPYPFSSIRGNDRVVRFGTGSIVEVFYNQPITGKPCPCRLCKESNEPKTLFWWVRARTATHVIHDRSEAEHAEFECFLDSDNNPGVKTIYGVDTFNIMNRYDRMFRHDVCDVMCVTHDHDTVAVFNAIVPANNFLCPPVISTSYSPSKVIVSHPHGCSKRITIGNVIHLTVPIGPDYPVNTPIPFNKGTTYRQVCTQSSESEKNDHDQRKRSRKTDDELTDDAWNSNAILKEKLNKIRDSIDIKEELKLRNYQLVDVTNLTAFNVMDSREKYIVEFYLLFIREHCLKILILAAIVEQKCKGGVTSYEQTVKNAFDEVFRAFLGKNNRPTHDMNTESQSASTSTRLQYWVELLRESEDSFIKFKSRYAEGSYDVRKSESVIVAWFHEVETIMDSLILDAKQKGVALSEDMLPILIDRGLKAGFEILATHEDRYTSNRHDIKSETDGVKRDKEDDKKEDDKKEETDTEIEEVNELREGKYGEKEEEKIKERVENKMDDKSDDDKEGEEEEKEEENDDKNVDHSESNHDNDTTVNLISEGSTFTLPVDAEYAFRVHSRSPGWFTFPPGTTMTLTGNTHTDICVNSDMGADKDMGANKNMDVHSFEFKNPAFQPEQCFVTYNTNTCPGSSGANVHCDILGPYLGTYFPHSGHLHSDINRSGIRDNFYTLYTKMFLYQPRDVPKHRTVHTPQRIYEGSKSLVQTLNDILKKS